MKRTAPLPEALRNWLDTQGWKPFAFQKEVWRAVAQGESGLLHAGTGAGKTYAVWLGALGAFDAVPPPAPPSRPSRPSAAPPLTVLWITPMRALAADTARALSLVLEAIDSPWTVGARTGDTGASERARQARRLPSALITTPESLSLMLSRPDAQSALSGLRLVVVDEWHELLGNKRGVQTQLALARLAAWQPLLQIWGLSATLGDLEVARDALLSASRTPVRLVRADQGASRRKPCLVDTLIPPAIERFAWAGHLGTRMTEAVARELDSTASALIFTNTRSQAELWYQALLAARPQWAGLIALHHSSLERETRDWVELGLKEGRLRAVVSTSSLDLGVDFAPVERVFQVGSPKGVARLLQRAGRSGHGPGRRSRVTLVPTHALELVEAAAARHAIAAGRIEARFPPHKPFDVLVQHLVTIALGGGFQPQSLFEEVRQSASYRDLSAAEFAWALAFVEGGGASLTAYPDYHRIQREPDGLYRMSRSDLARRHRHNIGTIVSEALVSIERIKGGRLGQVEESFISRQRPGDVFVFAGRALELVRVREMTAYVRNARRSRGRIPRWQGGRMPLSSELADAILERLAEAACGHYHDPEMRAVRPLLELQAQWSSLPRPAHLLIELLRSREGHHFFCYPFAGRIVHLGLGALLSWRAARLKAATFSISMNDYGFELLSAEPFDWPGLVAEGLFALDGLERDIIASLNASELALRRFREIARISGLVFQGPPGTAGKSARQLQASAGLFYQVFKQHDPDNLLLAQAGAEVMLQELDIERLRAALAAMSSSTLMIQTISRPTPFAFPLIAERFREQLSTEKFADRIGRMLAELEAASGAQPTAPG